MLMDLIRGVALIISGESTRYGVREAVSDGERERGRNKENNSHVFIHSGKLPLRGRRQREDERRDGGEC